jgi:hypothetical protein
LKGSGWDGSNGISLDGVMAALTARGIEYLIPPDTNNDLYYPATQEALLGAARVTGMVGQTVVMELDSNGFGIAVRRDPQPPEWVDPEVTPAIVTFVPEPASGMCAVLVIVAVRWRRG